MWLEESLLKISFMSGHCGPGRFCNKMLQIGSPARLRRTLSCTPDCEGKNLACPGTPSGGPSPGVQLPLFPARMGSDVRECCDRSASEQYQFTINREHCSELGSRDALLQFADGSGMENDVSVWYAYHLNAIRQ
jgi:hypothetical protein